MKQFFEDPKMEIICIGEQEILTTSNGGDGEDVDPWG